MSSSVKGCCEIYVILFLNDISLPKKVSGLSICGTVSKIMLFEELGDFFS